MDTKKLFVNYISTYSVDDFKQYCKLNGLCYDLYASNYKLWAIKAHELDLMKLIYNVGASKQATVEGIIILNSVSHRIKSLSGLTVEEAFNKVLTPDVSDFAIRSTIHNVLHVRTVHDKGANSFIIHVSDDEK